MDANPEQRQTIEAILDANYRSAADSALVAEHWEVAAGLMTHYQISNFAIQLRGLDPHPIAQAAIAERVLLDSGRTNEFVLAARCARCSVPLLEVAQRIDQRTVIAYIFTVTKLHDQQDCIDWIVQRFGDNRSLMLHLAREGCGAVVQRDPSLLGEMADHSFATTDRPTIAVAVMAGYTCKLAISTLRHVDNLITYRDEAGLDSYLAQNRTLAPLWLVYLLDFDLESFELATLYGDATGSAYLARRGPEYAADYAFYRERLFEL